VFGCLDVARAADLLGEHVDVFFVRDNADRAIGPIGQIVLPNGRQSWQAPKPKEAAKANSNSAGCQFFGVLKHNSHKNLRETCLIDPRWSELKLKSSLCQYFTNI